MELTRATRRAVDGGVEVELVRGRAALAALAPGWDALVRSGTRGAPFAHPDWVCTWLECFAPEDEPLLVHARAQGETAGVAVLVERRTHLLGLPLRVWETPANEHSQRTDWAVPARDGEALVRALWRRLREHGGWDALRLPNLVRGGLVDEVLGRAAEEDGFRVHREPSLESPWLPVPDPAGLEAVLDARFRANLRRRRRKLAAEGPLTLVRAEGGPLAREVLDEGLRLEAAGWKGREGTAIASQPRTLRFYTSLARALERRGWLTLYLLRAGDRAVAFHLALTVGGRYHLLKPAYDESLGACSPGQLLVEDVLRDLHARGVEVFDFLGPSMPWKLDWTRRLGPHCVTWLVRPSPPGRLLAARFALARRARGWAWARALKEEASRWRR